MVKPQNPKLIRKESIPNALARIEEKLDYAEKKKETNKEKRGWKFPFKWRRIMNKSLKSIHRDKVLFFYINIKGELEPPKLLPLYNGNTVIYRHIPREVDPRAFLTLRAGRKFYKLLIYKEIDRRPVSNLNYTEIKRRGDSTDSDEILIKAALRAQQAHISKQQIGRGAIVFLVLAGLGVAVWFFTRS